MRRQNNKKTLPWMYAWYPEMNLYRYDGGMHSSRAVWMLTHVILADQADVLTVGGGTS